MEIYGLIVHRDRVVAWCVHYSNRCVLLTVLMLCRRASLVLSLPRWLAETPEQRSDRHAPGYFGVVMSRECSIQISNVWNRLNLNPVVSLIVVCLTEPLRT